MAPIWVLLLGVRQVKAGTFTVPVTSAPVSSTACTINLNDLASPTQSIYLPLLEEEEEEEDEEEEEEQEELEEEGEEEEDEEIEGEDSSVVCFFGRKKVSKVPFRLFIAS